CRHFLTSLPQPLPFFIESLALSRMRPSNKRSYPQNSIQPVMKKSRAALHTAQILTGIIAAAAAYALKSNRTRRRPGQVVLITGGSRGLGLALAERYGRTGARLILAARDLEELITARRNLRFCPVCVPGGIFNCVRPPPSCVSIVGTSIFAPSAASAIVTGTVT